MTTDINSMRAVALGLSTALLSLAVAEIQPAQASEVFAFQCLKAVSYTHLTLPTKRIV